MSTSLVSIHQLLSLFITSGGHIKRPMFKKSVLAREVIDCTDVL